MCNTFRVILLLLSLSVFGQKQPSAKSTVNSTGVIIETGEAVIKADSIREANKVKHFDDIFSSKHFTIIYYVNGCFSQTATKYKFYKVDSVWIIECGMQQMLKNRNEFKLNYKIKTSIDDILNLKNVLQEALKRNDDGRCTTHTGCEISNENYKVSTSDRTCQHDDFNNWLSSKPKQPREIIK